jgi:UDP-N-acetylmuramate--alanine ligase
MNLDRLKKIYFLGIGGIGMSALARYYLNKGVAIYGYDIAKTSLTKKLEAEGMHIHYEVNPDLIPRDIDGVIITPAIPGSNAELKWLQSNGYTIKKRAEILGIISRSMYTIAIAGTHGKTTTSSVLAHILKYCGLDITAFLGGILVEENSNLMIGQSNIVVLEADEYDRSFLHLHPDVLVILSMDADHLDIYKDVESMYQAYEQLCGQIKRGGTLIMGSDCRPKFSNQWPAMIADQGINVKLLERDFGYENVEIKAARYHFDFLGSRTKITDLESFLPGRHNLMNTSIALEIADGLNCDREKLRAGVRNFRGIKRRFQILHEGQRVLIDDYAHHPEELRHAIATAKKLYPTKKVLGIFQPHLYSRTADFFGEFAEVLSALDEIWLLPIYPAREEAMEGVCSEMIYNLMTTDEKAIVQPEELVNRIKEAGDYEVIITLGASDIDKYHNEIISVLTENK